MHGGYRAPKEVSETNLQTRKLAPKLINADCDGPISGLNTGLVEIGLPCSWSFRTNSKIIIAIIATVSTQAIQDNEN
jgi:hypothetical protein